MLKQGSFINRKYYKLFAGSLLGAIANGVNLMLDSVLSGNQLGETALTAVSIVSPLPVLVLFFVGLFVPGYGVIYGDYIGKFDTENAYRIAGQMLVTSAISSAILVVSFVILKEPFLQYYGCTGELYANASTYYNWRILASAILPFMTAFYYLLAADADTFLISVAGIASIVANVVCSSIMCRYFGIAGLGMGTCICDVLSIVIYGFHWLKKSNSVHFKFSFRWKELLSAVKLSSAFAFCCLFISLTDIVMNKVILVSCGEAMITAYSVINLVYSIFDAFTAPYNAATGLLATFQGEKNNKSIKMVMKTTTKVTCGLGLALSASLLIFAPYLPKLYGIETPEIVEASVQAARWMALASVPYGIAYVMNSLYPSFGKVKLAIVMSFLNDFVCPLAMSIPLAFLLGFDGVTIGMSLNAFLALGFFTLFVVKKYGKKNFPLYLTDFGEEPVTFDLEITPESIVEIRDKAYSELAKRDYQIENLELLIEELYKRIYEKNTGKTVTSECTLLFGKDYVRIIVRDDGKIFNFVDENNKVESVNAHTLNSLLERVKTKEYALTTSFNRNGFYFEKQ